MPWLPKKFVVVPFDFSDECVASLDTALQLVASPEHLHIIHVLPTIEPSDPEYLWTTADAESRRHHALQALTERLADPRYSKIPRHVAFGEAAHEVADFAQKNAAELVVLPSHGRTGLTRLLIGSTAERIVRLAHCPVLVLRK